MIRYETTNVRFSTRVEVLGGGDKRCHAPGLATRFDKLCKPITYYS